MAVTLLFLGIVRQVLCLQTEVALQVQEAAESCGAEVSSYGVNSLS